MPDHLTRLGEALSDRYRVERELGEGGMATVYLAHDLKHDRQVAIKVLRPELAAVVGAERFLVEIKTTANLQHPHILPLYDSGNADGFLFYVMPYVRGESLRERLDREKQIAVDEAVALARKMADALDYAHEQGVVHRDIKPGNVLLSERGEPLIADFGIALAVSQAGGGRITETGLSLGTPHYMSPEQATGDREVDPRSDVYALGCVLYEMLAGEPPFAAPTAQAVLARILTEDARDVRELRRSVPEHVAATVARALEKLPADRFEDAASLKAALDEPAYRYRPSGVVTGRTARAATPGRSARPGLLFGVAGMAALGGVALGAMAAPWLGGETRAPDGLGTVVRMPLDSTAQFTPNWTGGGFDLSPDGSTIVFSASAAAPLEVIELDGPTRRTLAGTEGSSSPVFSHDGRWIAFTTNPEISIARVAVDGGAPTSIADNIVALPSAWAADGALYYSGVEGAYRVHEGEEPEKILDQGAFAARHVRPLDGGRAILYTEMPLGEATGRIMVRDLDSGDARELVSDGFDARYAPTGHLVYGRPDRSIVTVPFDLERLEVTGLPQVVLDSVVTSSFAGEVAFRLAGNGSAVYVRGPGDPAQDSSRVAFVSPSADRAMELPPLRPGQIQQASVSPDGRRLAYVRASRPHVFDLVTGRDMPLLATGQNAVFPVWSPGGNRIAYAAIGDGGQFVRVAVKEIDSPTEPLTPDVPGFFSIPSSWTPDGERLLVLATELEGNEQQADLVIVDTETGEVTPYLESRYAETEGAVSPDGRWAAYTSDETGSAEVFVRAFPDPGPAVRVSDGGGVGSAWSRDGDVLFYSYGDSVYAVDVDGSGDAFVAGDPAAILSRETGEGRLDELSVHPDGRFVMIFTPRNDEDEAEEAGSPKAPARAWVVVNWLREMRDRIEGR